VDVNQRIQEQLKSNSVVLYMKGTPDFPQCGFSAAAVRTLEACGASFAYVTNQMGGYGDVRARELVEALRAVLDG